MNQKEEEPSVERLDMLCELAGSKLALGVNSVAVVEVLIQQGADRNTARELVRKAEDHLYFFMQKRNRKKQALRKIFLGATFLLIGLSCTVGTLIRAINTGGEMYVVAWGACLYGAYMLFVGTTKYSAVNRDGLFLKKDKKSRYQKLH